ncbi:MAG: hypothetical protein DRO23_04260 [Thermoprotei archaeon]|nr:MAG: hypothetical protein DRO23_04260 [Thermoprotei archaeon]
MEVKGKIKELPEEVSKFLDEFKKEFKERIINVKVLTPRRAEIVITRNSHKQIIKWIREKFPDSSYLVTINTVDYIDREEFEIQYEIQIAKNDFKLHLTLKMHIPRDYPVVETITDVVPGALLYEGENYEMFGIKFVGHPALGKVFLPEDWPDNVYPLRKDVKLIKKVKKIR